MDEAKEFVGESERAAIERAASYFGVPTERLDARVISEKISISGLAGRVVVIASVKEAPVELGAVGEFVSGVLERMHLGSRVRVEEREDDGVTLVTLGGEGARELARDEGRVLAALSHLAARAAQKLVGPEARARVVAAGGGSGEERLEKLARARAEEVLQSGKPVELQPMGSRERWVVHNALKGMKGLRTESVGQGRDKRVKIAPV
jgi:spoIIIJ-associated protein